MTEKIICNNTPTLGYNDPTALGCLVGTAYQVMLSQLDEALKGAGLDITTSEYLVLRALYCGDGIQQCEIAQLVGKDKAAVCRCVTGLAKKELVTTESVSHKCLRVYLSEKGRAMQPEILGIAASRHKALADLTTPKNLEIFTDILKKIVNSGKS